MKNQTTEFLTTELITVTSTEALAGAYEKMQKARIRHLPVVNSDMHIKGIITDRDFQRAMNKNTANKFVFNGAETVANYMSTEVRCVDSQAQLVEVVKIMMDEKISSVLIVDDKKLTGIMTTDDVLRMFFDILNSERNTSKDSSMIWTYLKPINEIATRLAEIGI